MSWIFWQTLLLLLSCTTLFHRGVTTAKMQSHAIANLISNFVTVFLLTSKALSAWTEAGTGWTCTYCCWVMKLTRLAAQQNGHCLSKCLQMKRLPALSHLKKEDLWWAALQMEKLSIGIELNKYSSLNVSKMPPPAQPRKRRKPAWEPAHNLVWGCLRQEWSLICCHFPYTGHHRKIKSQK